VRLGDWFIEAFSEFPTCKKKVFKREGHPGASPSLSVAWKRSVEEDDDLERKEGKKDRKK
jgi:hypothetical protein